MSKEAMKLALEALENSIGLVEEDYANAVNLYGKYPSRAQRLIGMETMRDDHIKAITALREALANEALDKMAENARELGLDYEPIQCPVCKAEDSPYPKCGCVIYVDEPRAWFTIDELNAWADKKLKENPQWAEQPAQQEPVAKDNSNYRLDQPGLDPLYTSPPAQRTWVGLTDEEKSDIWCVVTNRDFVTEDTHVYADAIEAKLKEKNT